MKEYFKKIAKNLTVSNWLKLLTIIILFLGIFLRFTNLDRKVYWGDEVATSLRISGYTANEFMETVSQKGRMTVGDVQKYQSPNLDRDLSDAFQALAGNPEHPPLYYLSARFWMQLLGDRVTNPRGVSAVISILVFPCLYWLCVELFQSQLVGLMAMSLVAISPIHLLYAQEAREYSLWTVTILLSSWTLLRALRTNTKINWLIYAVSLALSFYSGLLSAILPIVYSFYVLIATGFRWSQKIILYLFSSLIGVILFVPWIIVFINDSQGKIEQPAAWTKKSVPLVLLIKTWILNISRIFIDTNHNFNYSHIFAYLLIVVLVSYSVFYLINRAKITQWLFVLSLIAIPFLALALPDLLLSGRRSTVSRYLIPSFLGIQISVAYLLTNRLTGINRYQLKNKLWKLAAVSIFASGLISCLVIVQSHSWWNKYREYHHHEVAKIINQEPKTLVIANWFDMHTLSHVLNSQLVLQDIRNQKNIRHLGVLWDNIYIYNNEDTFKQVLRENPDLKLTQKYSWRQDLTPIDSAKAKLWKLERKYSNPK